MSEYIIFQANNLLYRPAIFNNQTQGKVLAKCPKVAATPSELPTRHHPCLLSTMNLILPDLKKYLFYPAATMAELGSWITFKKPVVNPPAAKSPAMNRNCTGRRKVDKSPAFPEVFKQIVLIPGAGK